MPAKIAKLNRQRLKGQNYWYIIQTFKRALDLPYSTIANWMGITTSNLTSMISQHLNPYPAQYLAFKDGLKNHRVMKQAWVDENKIKTCACGCGQTFLLGSPSTRKWFNKNKCRKS